MSRLPASSFAEIAVDCHVFANREAFGLVALETFVVRAGEPIGLKRALDDTKRSAATAGALALLFQELVPFEGDARAFIDELLRKAAS